AEQSRCTGDHFEAVTGRLLAGVVNSQNADAVLVGKLLEPTDDLIIAGVAVCFAADLADFLHGVDDNESGVGVFPHEILKLFVQPVSNLARRSCKVQPVGVVDAVHHKHPALDALKVILQGEV
ncbi:30S ribosomal protein S13, partial [Dysosmobacter welbionis]